jgi:hypothetical protein
MALCVLGAAGALAGSPAALAGTTFQAYEIDTNVVFTGNGGPGSTISVQANLVAADNHAKQIGSKNEFCLITGTTAQGHNLMWCSESLVFNGQGSLFAEGQVDETQIEAGVPQTITVFAGSGIYAARTGTETIQQIVFPDQFLLTIALN